MARIIEASALISAKTGDMSGLAAISRQLEAVSKAGELVKKSVGGASADLAKRVEEIGGKLRSIDNFRGMSRGLDQAGVAMRKAVQDANRLKQAIDETARPSRSMAAEYARASATVERATRAFREQGQAVRAARTALADAGIPVSQIRAQQAALSVALDKTTAAMRRQADAGRVIGRPMPARPLIDRAAPGGIPAPGIPVRPAHLPVGEVGGLIGAGAAVKGAIVAGASLDSERASARLAGWSDSEIATAEERAHALAGRYGTSPSTAFNLLRESVPTFGGSLGQTIENIDPFFKILTLMRQKSPQSSDEENNRQMTNIIKSAEILGYSSDPKKLQGFANFMAQMVQVHGSALRGEEVLNFAKSSKTAGSAYSFDYLASILPTTLPELGGDRLGTASMTLRQSLVGGRMKKRAAENLADLGIVDRGGMIETLDADVKGVKPSAVKGVKLLEENPLRWVNEILVPAMDSKGVKPEERSALVSTLFSDRNSEYLVNLLLTQNARMRKDQLTVERAKGLSGAEEALRDDPFLAGKRVSGGLAQAGSALSGPFLEPLKNAADMAASSLTSLAETARGDKTSTGVGVASGGLLGALLGGIASAGSGIWLRGAGIAAGGGMGAIGGGLMLPWMTQEFLKSLNPRGPEGSKSFYGSALPGFAGELDKSYQAQRDRMRDPEGFRGRQMLDLSRRTTLEAVKPQEVAAKVEGSATLSGNITVTPSPLFLATIDQRIEAKGNLSAGNNGPGSNGRSLPEASAPTGSSATP